MLLGGIQSMNSLVEKENKTVWIYTYYMQMLLLHVCSLKLVFPYSVYDPPPLKTKQTKTKVR